MTWKPEDTVTTTFRSLKQSQAEAIYNGVVLAMDYLEDINYHTGANALEFLLEALQDNGELEPWQQSKIVEVVEFVKAWK